MMRRQYICYIGIPKKQQSVEEVRYINPANDQEIFVKEKRELTKDEEKVVEFLKRYEGYNSFIRSIREIVHTKGYTSLSSKQQTAIKAASTGEYIKPKRRK